MKRHNAQLKVKSSRRSLHFSQKQFSECRQIQISLDSLHKLVRTKSVCAIQVQGKDLQSNQDKKVISWLSARPKQTRLRKKQSQLIEIISQRIENKKSKILSA
jgi:hypothetical protein